METIDFKKKELDNIYKIISQIGEVTEPDDLYKLFGNKKDIIAYDGFEPSGRMHIAQGILRTHNVNKLTKLGVKFKFWIADWFALMNLKLGGDLNKIQKCGKEMIRIWEACGMDMDNVEFIWSSEEIKTRSAEYWQLILDIATKFNLNRIKKCTKIMGREESDELATSQIFYPVMQCADIFFLKANIISMGTDQLKVNMLAREYCDKTKSKFKPVTVSHPMLMGLDGSDKMSKSNPDNTIFMDESEAEVRRKINKAFCEPGNIEKNPLLNWAQHLIFPIIGHVIIPGDEKWNEPELKFDNFITLENDFKEEKIFPKRLKQGLANHIIGMLKPIHDKLKK